jgi:hypothetical protein
MQIEVHTSGYLRATTSFLPQTEKMAKEVEMGLEATICFAKMDEGGDKKNRVGMQIANPNLVIQTEPLKERVHWNPKTPFEEILKNHNLTWLWIEAAFSFQRAPSCECLVVEYSHDDEVFDGLLVAP